MPRRSRRFPEQPQQTVAEVRIVAGLGGEVGDRGVAVVAQYLAYGEGGLVRDGGE